MFVFTSENPFKTFCMYPSCLARINLKLSVNIVIEMEYLKCVLRSSNTDYLKLALNEIVIEHGTSQNLIDLNLFINEIFVTSFEVRLNFN